MCCDFGCGFGELGDGPQIVNLWVALSEGMLGVRQIYEERGLLSGRETDEDPKECCLPRSRLTI